MDQAINNTKIDNRQTYVW